MAAKQQQRRGGSPKGYRFGGKQKHGNSRQAYFVTRQLWRAAQNKARRIKKDAAEKEKVSTRRQLVAG